MILKEYVRGTGRRKIGMVVAIGPGQVGWSLCHKSDEFDRNLAEQMAIGRAQKLDESRIDFEAPDSVRSKLDKMRSRSYRYFK